MTDGAWKHHPAGRAHFRLLWVHGASPPKPILWLETVNCDFEASRSVDQRSWQPAVLKHAVDKAKAMGVSLSVESFLARALEAAAADDGGAVTKVNDRLVLRPSNGVVEASDYLTRKVGLLQGHVKPQPSVPTVRARL